MTSGREVGCCDCDCGGGGGAVDVCVCRADDGAPE